MAELLDGTILCLQKDWHKDTSSLQAHDRAIEKPACRLMRMGEGTWKSYLVGVPLQI